MNEPKLSDLANDDLPEKVTSRDRVDSDQISLAMLMGRARLEYEGATVS